MPLSEQDQMHVFLLARQRMLEAILARVVVTIAEPNRSAIMVTSRSHAKSLEEGSLFDTASDEELEISQRGYDETLRAVFGEPRESTGEPAP